MARTRNGKAEYVKLEQRLVLLAWLNGLFGYESNRDLLADRQQAGEGFDAGERSDIYHRLVARGDKVKIAPAALARYDDNIRGPLEAVNARRSEPITLRYFQHLAVLYTEIFLDSYFNSLTTSSTRTHMRSPYPRCVTGQRRRSTPLAR